MNFTSEQKARGGTQTMLSRIRKRFTYTNFALTIALIFAMTGGAYAAGKYVISSTKQISPKVLKSLQGKPGKAGANGAIGATGPAGATGPTGPAGATGKEGPAGKEGAVGPKGETGPAGKDGTNGTTGFTETLPKGKTLKGEWDVFATAAGADQQAVNSVSFGIPLSEQPTAHFVRAPTSEEEGEHKFPTPPAGCIGNVQEPGAERGQLCVFAGTEENSLTKFVSVSLPQLCGWEYAGNASCSKGEVSKYGFGVKTLSEAAGSVELAGTWAVTAE
jgi:hypothetical protein